MKTIKYLSQKPKAIYAMLVCALSLSAGCLPGPDKGLVPDVQLFLADGRATHKQITDKISLLLTSFAVVPALDFVINEPYDIATSKHIFKSELETLEGVYQENPNVPGDFSNFVASPGAVTVTFNNGIRVTMTKMTYNTGTRLTSFELQVTSSATTPVAEQVTMAIKEERLNALGFLPGIESGGLRMTGDVTMDINGVQSTFKVNRGVGVYTDPSLTSSHGKGSRYYLVNRNNNDYYRSDSVLTYIPSDVPGTWVGLLGSDTYSDKKVGYDVNLLLKGGAATGASATYVRGGGSVVFSRQRYASISGGPYTCDLNTPSAAGSGTPIGMTYIDGSIEPVMPSDLFTCSMAAIPDPTVP